MSAELRYADAVLFAARAHAGQVRKGSNTPYIAHPLAVSALVIGYGGDEDQAIAALLHDVVEDCDVSLDEIRHQFGGKVALIVKACTDGVPDASGKKPPWAARKEAYIASIAGKAADALLVVACDKLHNAESIVADFGEVGAAVFERFTAEPLETAWYYREITNAIGERAVVPFGLMTRLRTAVKLIEGFAKVADQRSRPARVA